MNHVEIRELRDPKSETAGGVSPTREDISKLLNISIEQENIVRNIKTPVYQYDSVFTRKYGRIITQENWLPQLYNLCVVGRNSRRNYVSDEAGPGQRIHIGVSDHVHNTLLFVVHEHSLYGAHI